MSFGIRRPQFLTVGAKAIRGLTFETLLPTLQFVAFKQEPEVESEFKPLEPGGEVQIDIELRDIPTDANFSTISAELTVQEQKGVQPTTLTQTSRVTKGNTTTAYSVELDVPSLPTSLTARLEGGEVFWSFTGPSAMDPHSFPDLAEEINAYLDRLKAEKGEIERHITLPFRIQSNNAGEAKIAIKSLQYSRLKTQYWENELDSTIRVDRNLQLNFATVQEVPLDPIAGAAEQSVVLRKVTMDVGGEFGPERMLGQSAAHDGQAFATISSDYSLAQGFTLPTAIQCVGVHGLFTNDLEAELYLELQSDNNNSPATAAPLARSNLSLPMPESNADPPWTFASFDAPVDLQAGVPYWLVIKGIQGKVLLAVQTQAETHLATILVNRGGQLWKEFGPPSTLARLFSLESEFQNDLAQAPTISDDLRKAFDQNGVPFSQNAHVLRRGDNRWLVTDDKRTCIVRKERKRLHVYKPTAALLRLVYVPEIDNQSAAITLSLKNTSRLQPLDPATEVQCVALSIPKETVQRRAVLVIESQARGTLSIANVVQEYLPE